MTSSIARQVASQKVVQLLVHGHVLHRGALIEQQLLDDGDQQLGSTSYAGSPIEFVSLAYR
jgi:hypothetical protein